MNNNQEYQKYIYWIPSNSFDDFKKAVESSGYKIQPVKKTSSETLKADQKTILYASPEIFSGLCNRQGSWYRESNRNGSYLVVSDERLPAEHDDLLDSVMGVSDFKPTSLPDPADIKRLVKSKEYQDQKPEDWEKKTLKEGFMYKLLFTVTGAWGLKDSLKKHWNNHRANHANFLSHEYTTELDGENVPYTVTNNDGVCSSCVEFFNVIDQDSRKLVRSCPGSVHFSNTKLEKYYDVKPVKKQQ